MIKSENGNTAIQGTEHEIMSDATCMVRALREVFAEKHGAEGAEKRIQDIVRTSSMSEDELTEEIVSKLMERFLKG